MDEIRACFTKSANTAAAPPAETLYIYYLQGRVKSCEKMFDTAFIGNWEEDDCSFLFFSRPAEQQVANLVSGRPGLSLRDTFVIPYEQWQPSAGFPLQAGGFLIYPPWQKRPEETGETHLLLDPGVVFGNGFHPTTSTCLEALEFVCCNYIDNIETAVDIGTGTGLLAVAAALWGVQTTIGIDLNFLAARTARNNVQLNRVDDRVLIVKADAKNMSSRPADLFLANIHHDVMEEILVSPGFTGSKFFILSGLLRTPAAKIAEKLNKPSTKIIKSWNNNNIWYTFLGKNLLINNKRSS